MTAEEIVMSGYAAFGSGDMDALGKLYHPQCKTTFHGDHALGGEYCPTSACVRQIGVLD